MNKKILTIVSLFLMATPLIARAGFLDGLGCIETGDCQIRDIETGFVLLMNFVLGGMAAIALIFFVWGGYQWLISGGNAERVKRGQQIMINTLFALVVAFGSYIGVSFIVNDLLNVNDAYRVESVCTGVMEKGEERCNDSEGNYRCSGYVWTGENEQYNGLCMTECAIHSIDDTADDWACGERWPSSVEGTDYLTGLCPGGADNVCISQSRKAAFYDE